MMRVAVGAGLLVWAGATLILSQWSRLSRPSLVERLRPFSPGAAVEPRSGGVLSVESFREIVGPLARGAGDKVASLFGVTEPLALRLQRIHSPVTTTAFRVRQAAAAGAALLVAIVVAATVQLPVAVDLLAVIGAPLLAFLVLEQRLALLSERWKRDLTAELPVVSEQLAMLVNAGYSLGAALTRLAERGRGCAARDLTVVVNRIRQGLSETDALREWAEVAGVDGVGRLVGILALHSETADLGSLISGEARQARRDLHRRTIETIERRAQQVWVPVTVATLVPGVILLAVPFLSALHLFANA